MKCENCSTIIDPGEEREHSGQLLCEDCYMDAMATMKTCDPWAVYSATSLERHTGGAITLTPIQSEILRILKETGGLEREALLEALGGKLTMSELEREFSILRHMEKARGEKRGEKVFLRVW
jgi:hypothetical protein